jgi:hypothetical protein
MNIRCLGCGHTIDLDDSYSDYEGQIKCYTCQALLEVKLSDGLVRSSNLYWQTVAAAPQAPPAVTPPKLKTLAPIVDSMAFQKSKEKSWLDEKPAKAATKAKRGRKYNTRSS